MASAADPTILASKRAVYVGGLAPSVTSQLLRAAMIPFGNIKSLDIVSMSTLGPLVSVAT
jgi:RNA recognition motif-containing protein